ncbi:MAG: Slp family lipoprotein [Gammaproteobacteria bacterium]|nr:Slp family lipoprotein [Gammaproteobacteria bacterium]
MKTKLRSSRLFIGLSFAMLLSACASHVPPEIKQSLEGAPTLAEVRDQPQAYLSQKVRWGGVILNLENRQDTSWLTILAYPLNEQGKPQVSDHSSGRFIAEANDFLEPSVYSRDRKITVIGRLIKTETIKVGDFPYEHPVVDVSQRYLWPEEQELSDYNYPPYWWYDPWYYPYYPWHYPYYPHYYR